MRKQTVAGRTAIGFLREVVLAAEREGAMARSTGVEVDAAVIEEAAKAAPAG